MLMGAILKKLSLLTLLVVLTACASKEAKNKKHQSELYFGAGTQSLMSQDYTDALTNLIKADKLDPDNAGILTNLAMAYYFKGEKDHAITTLKRSIELNEDNSDAKINLATIYYKDGNVEQAEKIYKEVLKDLTYDKQARTFYNLGTLELRKNNTVEAENYFNKSIKEEGNFCPSYHQIGLLQYSRKQYKMAYKNFKEASMGVCYESSPAAHYYQGLTLAKLQRYNEARMKFDEIDAKFKNSEFSALARNRMVELNELERTNPAADNHASRNVLESPEF